MRPNTGEPSHTSSKTSLNTTRRSLLGRLRPDGFSGLRRERAHAFARNSLTHSQRVAIQMWVRGMFFIQVPFAVSKCRLIASELGRPTFSKDLVHFLIAHLSHISSSVPTPFPVHTCCFLRGGDEEEQRLLG